MKVDEIKISVKTLNDFVDYIKACSDMLPGEGLLAVKIERLKVECAEAHDAATNNSNRLMAANKEIERLQQRLLTAAGDDLCRLTQEEIKELSSGGVQIPPKDEFLASCERFHEQIAAGPGVLKNCLTIAQLVAENAKLTAQLTTAERERDAMRE